VKTNNTAPTLEQMQAIATQAKDWPRVAEAAEAHGVPVRRINRAIARGEVLCWKLDVTRVEPVSLAAWLNARQP
jgi:ArsR family metal-binding transcriptional regulator